MVTEEQKRKISETLKRRYRNGELKARDMHGKNNSMYGRKQSEETKEKIRQKAIGRKGLSGSDNPATRPEVRQKISESHKGKVPWNKGLKGWVTEEHKNKIIKGNKHRAELYGTGYLGKKCFSSVLTIGKKLECPICKKFNIRTQTILELHHKDKNPKNNVAENIIILCSRHHLVAHLIYGHYDSRLKKNKKIGKNLEFMSQEEIEYIKKNINMFIKEKR
jgi:hypothetical protein